MRRGKHGIRGPCRREHGSSESHKAASGTHYRVHSRYRSYRKPRCRICSSGARGLKKEVAGRPTCSAWLGLGRIRVRVRVRVRVGVGVSVRVGVRV